MITIAMPKLAKQAVVRVPRRRGATPYLLVLPGFVFIAAFTIYPIIDLLILSLFRDNTAHPRPAFIGFGNFASIFSDPVFVSSLAQTSIYTAVVAPLSVVAGIAIAVLINKTGVVSAIGRMAFFYPIVLPLVSAASIWLFILTPDYGLFTQVMSWLGLGSSTPLTDPSTAIWAIGAVAIWRQAGFYAIFVLAGLQGIDPDVESAARLDGASAFNLNLYIRIPLIWPTIVFVLTLSIFSAFQTLDLVYVMTQGGPVNSTNMLLLNLYQTAFSFQDTGHAAAQSVVLLGILAIVAFVQIFVVDKLRGSHE